jgi:membrane protein DedA with SNARE-associated domain
MGNEIKNLQFTNSRIIEIFKIIFYNEFLIPIIILESEYILMLGGGNIIDYLNNLILYINKINLKSGKELQLIIKNKKKYLL